MTPKQARPRHRWSRRYAIRPPVKHARRIRYCVKAHYDGWSLCCRRYETIGGAILGYLPSNRDISRGLFRNAPRCGA